MSLVFTESPWSQGSWMLEGQSTVVASWSTVLPCRAIGSTGQLSCRSICRRDTCPHLVARWKHISPSRVSGVIPIPCMRMAFKHSGFPLEITTRKADLPSHLVHLFARMEDTFSTSSLSAAFINQSSYFSNLVAVVEVNVLGVGVSRLLSRDLRFFRPSNQQSHSEREQKQLWNCTSIWENFPLFKKNKSLKKRTNQNMDTFRRTVFLQEFLQLLLI